MSKRRPEAHIANDSGGYYPQINKAMALMPQGACEIIRTIGEPAALTLFEKLGGTHFPMVKGRTRAGQDRLDILSTVIGETAAQALCKHYSAGNENLYIPLCSNALRFVRDLRIKQGFDELVRHYSSVQAVNLLVAQYRLSDRTIWRILKTPDVIENVQEEMF